MNTIEILARVSEIIEGEKGYAVTMDSMFIDAELDSLGTMITLITIDSEFHIFSPEQTEIDFEDLDIPNLTIRDLVEKCISSITSTSMEPKNEKST